MRQMMVRTFISVKIPDTSCLKGVLDDVGKLDNVRPSPLSQMHITLKFIGDVDERRIPKVIECVRSACRDRRAFDITLSGTGCFPNGNRPSVVWIGASPADELTSLADSIGRKLSSAGILFDDKPFKAHITIGRCKGPADLTGFLTSHKDDVFTEFTCSEVLVMKSVLSPAGAKHSVLERIPLLV
ncbi:MAG: RNA 2',3'-cyclic phosphodiesterase [Candidatus Methanomethylophilaceae archaeon]